VKVSISLNKVTLIGNVGRDPEVRFLHDGSKVATFGVATSELWKDKNTGERKEKTEWHRVVVFNDKLAELIERSLHKGSKVFVEGQLQTREWQGPNGEKRSATEVVISRGRGDILFLDKRKDSQESSVYSTMESPQSQSFEDEDIPF
jgi:single-strand DNA-binding protein